MQTQLDLVEVEGRVSARVGTTDENSVEIQLAVGPDDHPVRVTLTLTQEQFSALMIAGDLCRANPQEPAEAFDPGYPRDDAPRRQPPRLGVVKGDEKP